MRFSRRQLAALAALLLAALAGLRVLDFGGGSRPPSPAAPGERRGPVRVARVLDGDTLKLEDGETVRLIGVDAPETHHPELPVQRFGEEASDFLRNLVDGFEVVLEMNPAEPRDKYGRTLAYVWKGESLVNAEIIRRGYAYAYTRFPHPRLEEFVEHEREARRAQYGLWHLSLRDGRLANLANRYEGLSLEGRRRLDDVMERLLREHPAGEAAPDAEPPRPPRTPSDALPWQEAEGRVGERVTVEGTVVAARRTAKVCFLNFHKDYRRHLAVVIFASALARFPEPPEKVFLRRRIRVTGEVREHEGRPEIVVEDPGAIRVVE